MNPPEIAITSAGVGRWNVEVCAGTSTTHVVAIPAGYLAKLGVAAVAPESVLEASFRFLLERESNTSILRSFALPVIAQYFPEYEDEIAQRLRDHT